MKWFATEHVKIRMAERGINKDMIDKAIATGTIVEGDKPKTYMIITNFVFVVITFSSNARKSCRVHTVYVPTEYQLNKRLVA